jgi:hypothetical protein
MVVERDRSRREMRAIPGRLEELGGDGKAAVAARTGVVEARVKLAEERFGGQPAHLWRELTAIRDGLPKWEGTDALKSRLKELEKDKLVRSEKKGRKKLLAYLHQEHALGKDAAKLGGTYRKLATKYAGTPSAEVAQERLLALGASVK